MGEIASASQLRLSYLRWALVTVPVILLLGTLSGLLSGSGYSNPWFAVLDKPALMPPGYVFPIVWTLLYILIGLAFAQILSARGARGRTSAIGAFLVQLLLNLLWSPMFFAWHQVSAALLLLGILFIAVTVTMLLFGRIRGSAGLLMLPYLVWLLFAAYLNFEVMRLNPNAETLVPHGTATQIEL
jgi:tryptophan-rich sensory protein